MVYTEMVSAEGTLRGNAGTMRLLDFGSEEHPIGVQLFGSDPRKIASACKRIDQMKPDLIDLNCGCPVKKVVTKNGGAALLKDLKLLESIISAMVDSTELPVTVKIRSGWDSNSLVAVEVAEIAQRRGADAITVHPRTQRNGFANQADWNVIASVRQAVKIPVIGSGDVFSPQDAKDMLERTGCDAVMIGRGSLGNPWIFSRANHFLETGELLPEPSIEQRIRICLEHAKLSVGRYGELVGVRRMRKHMVWYTGGMPRSRELRQRLFTLETLDQVKQTFQEYLVQVQKTNESSTDYNP